MGCYQAGHRDFGENYANELAEKAAQVCASSIHRPLCPQLVQLPDDIRWHYIGTLQSKKAKLLAGMAAMTSAE